MTRIIYDFYDVTFSYWGYISVEIGGTPEDLPWAHAERVESEFVLDHSYYTFIASVTVPTSGGRWASPTSSLSGCLPRRARSRRCCDADHVR